MIFSEGFQYNLGLNYWHYVANFIYHSSIDTYEYLFML